VRAIDVFANADNPVNDIVLKLFRGDTEVAEQDTVRTPERIRYSPDGGVPAGDYFVQLCDFRDNQAPVDPRTYTGTVGLDATAPPAPYTARWKADPANPPLNEAPFDPWGNPSTDTRVEMCWKQSTTASDCDTVVGNLASRSPWDFSPKANAATNTTAGNNVREAESWLDFGQPGANQFRPVSPTRDYTFPWTNEWFNKDCDPGTPSRPRP
jgi:extracellular elastinolytic metalloproteinase